MKTTALSHFIKYRRGIAAVCIGIVVSWVTLKVLNPDGSKSQVVVASHALAAGSYITASDIEVKYFPASTLWHGVVTSTDRAIGQTTSHAISPKAPLGVSDFVGTNLLKGFTANTVALSITPSQSSNISMLQPGNQIISRHV